MNKKNISIIVIATLLFTGLVYILVNEFNQPTAEEISARTTEVYQTEIVAYLTTMPTITPQPLPTNTPEVSPTPTEIVPMYDMFTAEDALLIYERPKFDSDVIGNLGAGESAVWAEERKDYSNDPNWHWYHVQFADVEKDDDELFDGYVAVLTEQGRQMTQDTCPAVVTDSFKFFNGVSGFSGGAGQGYASIDTTGYTLGKITTTTYGDAQIDSVNAVIVQLDPTTGLPALVPFNFVIGIQFAGDDFYRAKMNLSGTPLGECISVQRCGLDHVSEWWDTYGDETYKVPLNREFILERFDGKIVYGGFSGGGDLGTQFNYFDISTMSYVYDTNYVTDKYDSYPIIKKLTEESYRLFSQYEMETGDRMNLLFLRGKQVSSDWLNMGFTFTRFFLIPEYPTQYGYENTSALTQCLQAIGSY